MTDCLIIGHNDSEFPEYVKMVRSMGEDSGAFKDLSLAFMELDGKPMHALDLLTHLKGEPRERSFHNTDFLWPTILYLGTYLNRRGFTFDYVNKFQFEKEALRAKLLQNDILTIAITTTLYVSIHPILEIISFIREHNDRAKIIIGGPYISNLPRSMEKEEFKSLLEYADADYYVISSEGEQSLVNILTCLKSGADPGQIPNIAYRKDGSYEFTPCETERNSLEENMVDYSLFRPEELREFVTLRTAKSCPFSCAFCGFPQRAGKYVYLPVDLVEKELNALQGIAGNPTLTFIDDTFNVPKNRFQEIMRMMIRNRYQFKWNIFYRSDHGDEQTIDLMRQAGCEGVFLGAESGSDRMLKLMNKSARRADYMKAIPLLKQAGISTYTSLIIGFPGETRESVEETTSLVEQAAPDFFRAQLWYCDPVTPIWNRREEFGVQGSAFVWSHNTMDHREACAIIDSLFLGIQNSIWLPQNGFEMWSLFYLQRRGMNFDWIKKYLRTFNGLVADRIRHPQARTSDPARLRAVRDVVELTRPAGQPVANRIDSVAGQRFGLDGSCEESIAPLTAEEQALLNE